MKIIVTKTDRLGIMDLRGMKSYMETRGFDKAYVVVKFTPHPNVVNFAKDMGDVEIIENKNYKAVLEEIRQKEKDNDISEIDMYSMSERRFASDGD